MSQTEDESPGDTSPDLVDLLQADHQRMSDQLVVVGAGPGLVSELSAHLVAEAQLLYPALRRHLPDADVAVDALVEMDHRMEQLLADVDQGEADRVDAGELEGLWAEHVRQQEALFSELRQVAEPGELRRLGENLGPTIMEAPTHPHPHLPREGPLEVISDAVASSVDHLRAALKREDHDR